MLSYACMYSFRVDTYDHEIIEVKIQELVMSDKMTISAKVSEPEYMDMFAYVGVYDEYGNFTHSDKTCVFAVYEEDGKIALRIIASNKKFREVIVWIKYQKNRCGLLLRL